MSDRRDLYMTAEERRLCNAMRRLLGWFADKPEQLDDWGQGWFMPADERGLGARQLRGDLAECVAAIKAAEHDAWEA